MTPAENTTFIQIIVATFNTTERQGWGELFFLAGKAGWIDRAIDQGALHR